MNTHTKLKITSFFVSTMTFLVIGSHLLRFSSALEWALLLSLSIPLGLSFFYAKKLKEEETRDAANGIIAKNEIVSRQAKHRRWLLRMWLFMIPFTLSFPFWLPFVSGISLGRLGDFLVALGTLAMVSVIFWIQLTKEPNQSVEPTPGSVTPRATEGPSK